ncbi:MAG: SHOCT domain-containing protein [Coprobacillus sp.]|nr:SHOCT domain-containing protein [Coprobacillus sp.]
MKKEYKGAGDKAIVDVDENSLFIKSNILKENCFLPHIEWLKLGDVNFQGRGILYITTDAKAGMDIVFKRNQYDEMKELYEILLPYMNRMVFDQEKREITIYNKGNDDPVEKPINKVNVSNPYTFINFDDINSYEVICDKDIINMNMLQNTASGKYVAGGTGALIGALSSFNHGEFFYNLQIKLNLNNFDTPCVYINYITRKTSAKSDMGKDLIRMCDEDLAKLEIITKKETDNISQESNIKDPIEEVKKLKELLDMGILSQEEFDKKKKELLKL